MNNVKRLPFFLLGIMIFLMFCRNVDDSVVQHDTFSFWTVGSSDVNARFGVKIYDALARLRAETGQVDLFLYTIAETPLTRNQIRDRSGMTGPQVDHLIAGLDSCNMIRKGTLNQWATTLPVISDNQMKNIRDDLAPMAERVARYLEREIPQIRALYNDVKSPVDPSWKEVAHLIIDKFIIDAKFHVSFNRLRRERETDDGAAYVMPAFLLARGAHNANFGCNWYKFRESGDQREVYVLHGAVLERHDIAVNRYRRDEDFISALFSMIPPGGLDGLTDSEKSVLNDLNWITRGRLAVPVIRAATLKRVLPALEPVGRKAAEVAYARFSDMWDAYARSTYARFLEYDEDYIQVLIHSLFGLTIEALLKRGALPKVPRPVPEEFGVFVVAGALF